MSNASSPAILAPDVLLGGKYRLLRQIGKGAMGSVWAARNETTSREVALKLIIRPEPEYRLRLLREARACGALSHPNVIDVYDVGQTDSGDPFLVMQLLSGETVAALLAREKRLDPATAALIGRDIAKALAAAHAIRIVHRDLKPANIFLHNEADADGSGRGAAGATSGGLSANTVVKVLDFGVAKNLDASDGLRTAVGGAVGSPLYMSPEQVRADGDVDHRADIWALGVVLFELLAGARPFKGRAPQIFLQIAKEDLPSLAGHDPAIDPGLVEIVSRCMRRNREERFQTAGEIVPLLDRYVNGAGAPYSGAGAVSSGRGPAESHPALGAGAIGSGPDAASSDVAADYATTLRMTPAAARAVQTTPLAGVTPAAATPWHAHQPVQSSQPSESQAQAAVRAGSSPGITGPYGGGEEAMVLKGGTIRMSPNEVAKYGARPPDTMPLAPTPIAGSQMPSSWAQGGGGGSVKPNDMARKRPNMTVALIAGTAVGLCVAGAVLALLLRGC